METLTIADQEQSSVVVSESVNNVLIDDSEQQNVVVEQTNYLVDVISDSVQTVVVEANPTIINVSPETSVQVIEIMSVGVQGPAGDSSRFTGPEFTYTDEVLTRIDYDDGSYKLLSYTDDVLTRVDLVIYGGDTIRKDFVYSSGVLIRIDQSTL